MRSLTAASLRERCKRGGLDVFFEGEIFVEIVVESYVAEIVGVGGVEVGIIFRCIGSFVGGLSGGLLFSSGGSISAFQRFQQLGADLFGEFGIVVNHQFGGVAALCKFGSVVAEP